MTCAHDCIRNRHQTLYCQRQWDGLPFDGLKAGINFASGQAHNMTRSSVHEHQAHGRYWEWVWRGWACVGRVWFMRRSKPPAGRKVVLGQSVPLTGAASEIGLAFAAGAKLYVDAFNARKSNPGWNFELRQLDDGYEPAKATANAKKLLEDGADVLFGFVGTASSRCGRRSRQVRECHFLRPVRCVRRIA
jgi:hypothetical protein